MQYIVFAVGIILIIIGVRGSQKRSEPVVEKAAEEQEIPKPEFVFQVLGYEEKFKEFLEESDIMYKLDTLEDKLDLLWSEIGRLKESREVKEEVKAIEETYTIDHKENTQLKLNKDDLKDVNKQAALLKDEGLSVEEIADRLGILKGEVLLRLGMKK
ncbi:hypothetical protein OXPF_17940 [Oxobacter pfennigii]|uniref:Uncharacterized protein n=1 Tax=Oxobacter pfennigii TaxID=36849 RepID=A0A0P8WAG9_9CLOT|nr:hypothetical protein [Oxobacter pfennigii]KPU44708.1 hypothetical protein OXPF_17940 [Oxobacter pfennigii]